MTELLTVQGQEQTTLLTHLQTSLQQLDAVLQELNMVLAVRDKQDVVEPAESVVLNSILNQVLQDLQDALQQAGGQIVDDVASDLSVHGNQAYVHSIFFNLLSNSIKYRSPH